MSVRTGRPFLLTLLSILFFLLALAGLLRLIQAVRDWTLLTSLEMIPGPFYLAAGGFLWAVLALPAGLALFAGWGWAPAAARLAGTVLMASYWLDRLVIRLVGGPLANGLFAGVSSLVFLILLIAVPSMPSARRFFARKETP